ncbi:hypothetical protein [Mycoplasma nasistruthionis]|uniref:Uncharacterized protein n=1 Tax=Mycoplasma nasistruthionis TaxID=353852 RepID=A0A5B7XW19_9MOLU|nr:hypothetical protein [Mycoplasma nasistruthionis]QCZ36942.1 hypothetical protein FG904_02930 [Mycoplasma nasistruthionis]
MASILFTNEYGNSQFVLNNDFSTTYVYSFTSGTLDGQILQWVSLFLPLCFGFIFYLIQNVVFKEEKYLKANACVAVLTTLFFTFVSLILIISAVLAVKNLDIVLTGKNFKGQEALQNTLESDKLTIIYFAVAFPVIYLVSAIFNVVWFRARSKRLYGLPKENKKDKKVKKA